MMSKKFDSFKVALQDLCVEHGFVMDGIMTAVELSGQQPAPLHVFYLPTRPLKD